MKYIYAAIKWIFSVLVIPFVASYKAIRAGVIHFFNEVDRLFNFIDKEKFMTIFSRIESIEPRLAAVESDVATLKAAPSADNSAAIAELTSKVDALRADVGTPAVA
jgi:hypothetical protein